MTNGILGPMEISKNTVSCTIVNIDENVYNNYLQSLLEEGYTMKESGVYTNGMYDVFTSYSNDGSMNILLKRIDL